MIPPMTQFAADLYAYLEPVAGHDATLGFPLAVFCGAIGEAFKDVEMLVRALPGREPWQQAFDIDACPDFALPFLGQMIGVRVSGTDPVAWRQQVRAEAGFHRGRPSALTASVASTLTGSQRVRLIERFPDPWSEQVVTDPAETPDVTATVNAAQAAKVAGLVLSVSQSSVPLFIEGTRTFAAAAGTFATATLANVT